jgi:hypothetical protein
VAAEALVLGYANTGKIGVLAGYREWRVIPSRWIALSKSLHAQICQRSWSLIGSTAPYIAFLDVAITRLALALNMPIQHTGH